MVVRDFMLDTGAINRIHDWQQCPWSLRAPILVTDIQLQELVRCAVSVRCVNRRAIRTNFFGEHATTNQMVATPIGASNQVAGSHDWLLRS